MSIDQTRENRAPAGFAALFNNPVTDPVHTQYGSNTGGGWEYPLFWLVAQLALVLAGSDAFALRSTQTHSK